MTLKIKSAASHFEHRSAILS